MPPARRVARRAAVRTAPTAAVVEAQRAPIQSVAEGRSKTLALCVFGDGGVGKTVLAGSSIDIPDVKKVLIVRPPIDHTDSITDPLVNEWVVNSWSDMDDVMVWARTSREADEYGWVWLDSLSLWQDQGLDDIWERVIEKKPHRAEYGLDKPEYGKNMLEIGRWCRHMVGSDRFHFGVTCHPRQASPTEDAEDDTMKLMPWVQGKNMPAKLVAMMNVVGYLHKEDVRGRRLRVLDLIEADQFYAKVGFPGWDTQRIVNPTMVKLTEALSASSKAAAKTVAGVTKTPTGSKSSRKPTTAAPRRARRAK